MKNLFKNFASTFRFHQRWQKTFQVCLTIIFIFLSMNVASSETTGAQVWSVTKEYCWTVFTGIKMTGICMGAESLLKTLEGEDAAAEAKLLVDAGKKAASKAAEEIAEGSELDRVKDVVKIGAAAVGGAAVGAVEVVAAPEEAAMGGVLLSAEAASEVEAVVAPFVTRLCNNVVAKFSGSRVRANLEFLLVNSIFTTIANLFSASDTAKATPNNISPLAMLTLKALEDASEFVTVVDPNNCADSLTGLGAVAEAFQIGTYDVTVAEWAFFLTAVQATETDVRHLYHPQAFSEKRTSYDFLQVFENQGKIAYMCTDKNMFFYTDADGISRDYQSTRFPSPEAFPITGISYDDCKRYCNWRHNGCPVIDKLDEETLLITETGAYDFTNGQEGALCEGARYFLPTLNQWYKAAYYKGGGTDAGYWHYPLKADSLPFQESIDALLKPGAMRKGANCATITSGWFYNTTTYYTEETPYLTPVGFFKDSPGPCGAYDLGGNVREWTSDLVQTKEGSQAIAPGGSWAEGSDALLNTHAKSTSSNLAGSPIIGLRICASADQLQQDPRIANQQTRYVDGAETLQTEQQQAYARDETFCKLFALGVLSEAVAFFGLEVPAAMNGSEKQTWEQLLARWDKSRWAMNLLYVGGTSILNAIRDVPLH